MYVRELKAIRQKQISPTLVNEFLMKRSFSVMLEVNTGFSLSIAIAYCVVKGVQISCRPSESAQYSCMNKKSLGNLELAMYFLGSEEEKM